MTGAQPTEEAIESRGRVRRVVAVTGASGFIGRALLAVHKDDHVRVLTRNPHLFAGDKVDIFEADLREESSTLTSFADGVDVLYNCAGDVRSDEAAVQMNIESTRHIVDAARGRVGRFVQLSSIGVYGQLREGIVNELTAPHPADGYERSKLAADKLVENAARAGAISCAVLRPSTVFGPTMPNMSLRQLAGAVRRRLFFFIGKSGASANYIYVTDVARALHLCGTKSAAHNSIYNLSDWCTIESFVGGMAEAMGRRPPRARLPESLVRSVALAGKLAPAFPLSQARIDALTSRVEYPADKITRELGYTGSVSIPAGIRECVSVWNEEGRRE